VLITNFLKRPGKPLIMHLYLQVLDSGSNLLKKLFVGCLLSISLFQPTLVGWKVPKRPAYTIDKIVETQEYVDFWIKQRRHGWNIISYIKDDGQSYFIRNKKECKFW